MELTTEQKAASDYVVVLQARIAELEQQVAELSKDKVRLDVIAKMWMRLFGVSKETLMENIDAFIPKEQEHE